MASSTPSRTSARPRLTRTHWVWPTFGWCIPEGHRSQSCANAGMFPSKPENVSGSQGTHEVVKFSEKPIPYPGEQATLRSTSQSSEDAPSASCTRNVIELLENTSFQGKGQAIDAFSRQVMLNGQHALIREAVDLGGECFRASVRIVYGKLEEDAALAKRERDNSRLGLGSIVDGHDRERNRCHLRVP
eukprot:7377189-Prymnesium_polylepis.1